MKVGLAFKLHVYVLLKGKIVNVLLPRIFLH